MSENNPTSFIERIANNLSASLNNKVIFGDPIEHAGVKIIPVSKIRYGFGGGYGHEKSGNTGKGAGGGMMAKPIGYIELKDGQANFKRISALPSLPILIIAGFFLIKGTAKLLGK